MKYVPFIVLTALLVGAFAFVTKNAAQLAPTWIDAPELPDPAPRCSEPAEHAAHRAGLAEQAAHERAAVYALVPGAGLTARARFAEAEACAGLAGDAPRAARIASVSARFNARLARDYAQHVERYRLARRAGRAADAAADIAFIEALWSAPELASHAQRGPFLEQLRADRANHIEDRS
jgi:hypothetical protein